MALGPPVAPVVQTKGWCVHLCGAIPPGLLPWSAIHVLSAGRRDPVLGSKGPLCPMHRSFGFCSQWEFLLMLFLWLVAQGRGYCKLKNPVGFLEFSQGQLWLGASSGHLCQLRTGFRGLK